MIITKYAVHYFKNPDFKQDYYIKGFDSLGQYYTEEIHEAALMLYQDDWERLLKRAGLHETHMIVEVEIEYRPKRMS